jgi:DNA processing protein
MPEELKQIPDPPLCLFIKGNVSCLSKGLNIGIVGTRKVSAYGRQVTTFFSSQLAKNGATVVSGMALGVDTLAHTGSLDGGGKTIAVLGCGVDIIYPTINRLLYQRILDTDGAIVSELPPGCMPRPFTFVLRNRIIAGLSRGVLVVEGGLSSGSMITAAYATEQGKDVYAVPMPILSPLSAGPNSLLKQGAKLVLDPEDILSEYGISKTEQLSSITNDLPRDESLIYLCLQEENSDIHMLIHKTRLPVQKLLVLLSSMELKGIVSKNKEGRYEALISPQSGLGV